MPQRFLRSIAAVLFSAVVCGFTYADSVTLVSGKTISGKISLDAKNAISVAAKDLPPVRADVRDIVSLKVDAPKATAPARLATLLDGTRIAATEVLSMDDREIRLKRVDGSVLAVNTSLVSTIDFAPADAHTPPTPNFVGVQLGGKDTAEGDVLSISPKSVKVSSVLFGVQEFDTAKNVQAVYLRPTGVSKAAYIIRGRDGSSWQALTLAIEGGKINLTTDLAGPISVAANDLLSIDLGPASADDLSSLTASPDQPLRLAPGQQQNVNVGGKYRAIVLTYRIPDIYMPIRSARLIMLADDNEIAKTEPLTSLDPAVTVTRPISGAKTLTFRLEATGPTALGIAGEIVEARLIRSAP